MKVMIEVVLAVNLSVDPSRVYYSPQELPGIGIAVVVDRDILPG
jgi:hypothetical protein